MISATFILVTLVMPCNPGDRLTSSTSGPFDDGSMSTAHMSQPAAFAAATAIFVVVWSSVTFSPCPPAWMLALFSPFAATRFIAAATLSPTTMTR